ncbi:hypothetical protein RRG08_027034 [Elysia crispata]|uniref:Uncharacterized protein n=1 Tax=Elysia crispata TaxID=231223 RepID=A0AAE0ZHE4_9GAST|nr:hypothetical protein RRG08_027034 [Elysia crispata]
MDVEVSAAVDYPLSIPSFSCSKLENSADSNLRASLQIRARLASLIKGGKSGYGARLASLIKGGKSVYGARVACLKGGKSGYGARLASLKGVKSGYGARLACLKGGKSGHYTRHAPVSSNWSIQEEATPASRLVAAAGNLI